MLTAFMSPARCVAVSCLANASTATRPSGSYGNRAAAIPCTLRRGRWRLINSSIVMPEFAMTSGIAQQQSMSSFLRLVQLIGEIGAFVVFVQRIATGGQSDSWCRGAITEGSAKTLALDLAPL